MSEDEAGAARRALAEALSEELCVDLAPELMVATDKILIRLFLSGFVVAEATS